MIAISACLMGVACRYNGSSVTVHFMDEIMDRQCVLLFCPEVLGGFGIPREPVEIVQGTGIDVLKGNATIMDKFGNDVTEPMLQGASCAAELIRNQQVKLVVLKDKSPSCGLREIHDGSFSGKIIKGCGILPAMLEDVQIPMFTENETEGIKIAVNKLERMDTDE